MEEISDLRIIIGEGASIDLDDLRHFTTLLIRVLRRLSKLENPYFDVKDNYEIVAASVNSPLTLSIRESAQQQDYRKVLPRLIQDLKVIEAGGSPPLLDDQLGQSYAALARYSASRHQPITWKLEDQTAHLSQSVALNFMSVATARSTGQIEMTGYLDALNVHTDQFIFYLYPNAPSGGRVQCRFPQPLLASIQASVKQFVRVRGTAMYPSFGLLPARIEVDTAPEIVETPKRSFRTLARSLNMLPAGADVYRSLREVGQ